MIVPRYYEDLRTLPQNTMPYRAYYNSGVPSYAGFLGTAGGVGQGTVPQRKLALSLLAQRRGLEGAFL